MSGFDDEGREQAAAIEAVLTVATEPVTTQLLAELLEVAPERVDAICTELETLAIVAYKQPISRGQIGAIRGVNPEGVMRVLVERGYVEAVGHDSGPGQAVLFGTTKEFLERLGLDTLADLPPLEHFVPDAEVVESLERVLRTDPGE
jgi:segregation and condensation protein B